ncbi:hypothetical protein F0L17_21555 [Streptomyces sp. TRM43335]|uniref:Lipoprotein n=1 Tax=Streptomyces taklimakanensis TaxID=2569853 RepID=A0A6G2BID3_9ACTN|nr:hypothetical protein [Streptomyces taklimakanensis]MTE21652.1 hypothetical protein [Streptomyces taklimakanensis]
MTTEHRVGRAVALVLPLCAAALTACTGSDAPPQTSAGPTATSTAAPAEAEARAERYRNAGGDEDVYALHREPGPDGAPLLVVRTHDPNRDDERFQELKGSVVTFLAETEGLPLGRGYLMDVFGPDGALLHRLDARP